MNCQPSNIDELTAELIRAGAEAKRGLRFDLKAFKRVLEYTPEDMTVTVEAGISLAALQEHLAEHGQWLPIDPPNPETTSIADVINSNTSGPRRLGYGTIREHLLGLTAALADGRLIHNGGKVVKNVAGYDLCKLFVGSRGSLGVLLQAAFKVRPLPEAEQFVSTRCDSLSQAAALLETIQQSELIPVVLDLHNGVEVSERRSLESVPVHESPRSDARSHARSDAPTLLIGLAGTREDVAWQVDKAAGIGLKTPASLDYEKAFWNGVGPVHRLPLLPSRLTEALGNLGATEFVARAGDGVIYYRGGKPPPKAELPLVLMRRIKEAYDPGHVLPDIPELTL